MKYEDLKCEFCDGHGEREINVDGADCPQECSFCDGTGIDQDQLMKLPKVVKMLEALKLVKGYLDSCKSEWQEGEEYLSFKVDKTINECNL